MVDVRSDRYDASLPVHERKRHGVYYTPEPVVRYLLRATAPAGPVADLSCGDGAFLVEAAEAGYPVMGVDRDPAALSHAAAALAAFPQERVRLHEGDGLQPALLWTPDVVLGNPPYLEAKKADRELKKRCRKLFPDIARGGFDIYVPFLKAGLDTLPPGGRLGYIVPNKFLIADYARRLRELLLAETTIEEVIDVSDIPTFRDAAVYPVMLVVRKALAPAGHRVQTGHVTDLEQLESGNFARAEILQARWSHTQRCIFWLPPADEKARALVDRLLDDDGAAPLSEVLDLRWAISFHRAGLRDKFVFPEPTGRNPRRLLGGMRFHGNGDVGRYRTAWSGWWVDYDEERARQERNQLPPWTIFTGEKLVIAQNTRRITATLDREEFACKDTFLVGRQQAGVPLPYLLGLLNSTLLSYLYAVLFKGTHVGGAYLHYLACYLEELPIRIAADPMPIIELVNRLLASEDESERRALDEQIDKLVCELYGLSVEERELIRQAVPAAYVAAAGRRGRPRMI